ncbi:elongation factor P 5-aminopentanone reductase [Virgibacillus xinjiangensis]|uniref:Elongation factor P 5-aminopentanone reductase n=1 Tax=Virgibacillus xinjiangensis TaxID=393090 RepID=A0ABV7CVC1_9BACI
MKKNVLVVGASGDIGIAISRRLAEEGYHLLLHFNRNRQPIDTLREELEGESVLAVIQSDLSREEEIKRFLTELVFPVDHIVFASGMAHYGLFQEAPEQIMDEMLMLHVKAPWMITKHLLPRMIQDKAGNIVLVTSIWGEEGASNEVIYSSVKGAQNAFVKALAKEAGPSGILVNAVSPGFIETKMNQQISREEREAIMEEIPLSRAGKPDEVAHVVSFLLEKKSSYIQGEIIKISGGW